MDPYQLAQEAGKLDDLQWHVFIDKLGETWHERNHAVFDADPSDASRDAVAAWIARQHLATDPGVTAVWYLPTDAPDGEIRLLEINTLLGDMSEDDVVPVDFGLDVEGLNFKLLVADVTPMQWQRIHGGELPLPQGWSLEDARQVRLTGP